jgi:hypothetical protein
MKTFIRTYLIIIDSGIDLVGPDMSGLSNLKIYFLAIHCVHYGIKLAVNCI